MENLITQNPKLSIITINLNNTIGLRQTIESVVNQTYADFEYIIIDGGSNDGSVDVIKGYSDKITYWISEPDNGIYNAMNKGVIQANAEYCLFLNSGDWLLNENILSLVFSIDHSEDLVCCKLLNHSDYFQGLIQLPKEKLTFYDFYSASLSHPSTFIKTKLFIENGLYDENKQIVSDWKFFVVAVVIHKCSYITLDIETTGYAPGGISSIYGSINNNEREAVINDLFPFFIDDYKLLYSYNSSQFIKMWKKLKDSNMFLSIYKFLLNKNN